MYSPRILANSSGDLIHNDQTKRLLFLIGVSAGSLPFRGALRMRERFATAGALFDVNPVARFVRLAATSSAL